MPMCLKCSFKLVLFLLYTHIIDGHLIAFLNGKIGLKRVAYLYYILGQACYRYWWQGIFRIGLYQMLCLWPGFSRSGATIAGGMLIGCTRRAAADFSFIMAVPVMIIVCIYDLLRVIHLLDLNDIIMFAIGTLVSYIVGYITVKVFLWYLNRSSLSSFGYYRIIVAILAIIYLYLWLPMRKKWSLKSLEKILA